MVFESFMSWVAGKEKAPKEFVFPEGITQEVLDKGLQTLVDFEQFETPAMDHAEPPVAALPLLALIAQYNYCEEKDAKGFYDHLPSLAVKHIYRHGDSVPYVRILYTKLSEGKKYTKAAPEDPSPIMIVSFTGSVRAMDWVDDMNAFMHVNGGFLHGKLGFVSMHRGFANWLTRPLDRTLSSVIGDVMHDSAETLRHLLDRAFQGDLKAAEEDQLPETVYSRTIDMIAEIRQGYQARFGSFDTKGVHELKTFVIGHSLGGAAASLFGLRISGIKLQEDWIDRKTFLKLFSDPRCAMAPTEDNLGALPPDGVRLGGPRIHALLVLSFGAPRYLWRDPDTNPKWVTEGNMWMQNYMPVVRIVNERDPVPHVPAGRAAPENLPTILVDRKNEKIEMPAPDASHPASAADLDQSIPIMVKDVDSVEYEHVGHQWVLDGKTMEKRQGAPDAYGTGALDLFKDIFTHGYKDNIAKQHSMSLYVERVAKVAAQAAVGCKEAGSDSQTT